MSHPDGQSCSKCGCELSLEVGIVRTGTLAEDSVDKLYCEPCAPNRGKGYTLADLERMREELREAWAKTIRDRELRLMEQLGPDVYFFVAGAPPNADGIDAGGSP